MAGLLMEMDLLGLARLRIPVLLGLDMNESVIEVDVIPLKVGHLPFAHTGEDEELQHGADSLLCCGKHSADFLRREEARLFLRNLEASDFRHIRKVAKLDPELEDTGEDL